MILWDGITNPRQNFSNVRLIAADVISLNNIFYGFM